MIHAKYWVLNPYDHILAIRPDPGRDAEVNAQWIANISDKYLVFTAELSTAPSDEVRMYQIEAFVAKHGFLNTPAGDRMVADLKELMGCV